MSDERGTARDRAGVVKQTDRLREVLLCRVDEER
jgi:hypothetical protein